MAFKEVTRTGNFGEAVKASQMEEGEVIEAYVVELRDTTGEYGDQTNLIMQKKGENKTFMLYTAGTLKYDAKDGRITTGLMTRITRLSDESRAKKDGKGKYVTSVFRVEQDDEDTVESRAVSPALIAANSGGDIAARARAVKEKALKD
jgi:hypothetical protein